MTVRWEYCERTTDAVAQLKAEGYRLLAIEQVEGAVMLIERLIQRTGKRPKKED